MCYNFFLPSLFAVCCTAEVSGENTEIMEISLLHDESDAGTTSLLPLPLLSYSPRSMVINLYFPFRRFLRTAA
jgi:hypothetical protein